MKWTLCTYPYPDIVRITVQNFPLNFVTYCPCSVINCTCISQPGSFNNIIHIYTKILSYSFHINQTYATLYLTDLENQSMSINIAFIRPLMSINYGKYYISRMYKFTVVSIHTGLIEGHGYNGRNLRIR